MTDELDRASGLEMADRERALNARLNRVKEVPEESGFCNDCGDAIDPARIAVLPDAVTCIDCQTLRERSV
ncbi:TPA: TraR/DksA C4-type zinc finger protein [Citrobacter koseri]|uniref:RNA polymerase-binding transcription factor n=1 Tax=Citrobacter koseri TaxID=545 RepID=A0A3S4IET8_CITKO|nr:RNA polymerase-binding transcription factor [Citrobacter koseri]HEM6672540.1 TraR/DksA C4-type zinc finger protein [Citrobacter koseri]